MYILRPIQDRHMFHFGLPVFSFSKEPVKRCSSCNAFHDLMFLFCLTIIVVSRTRGFIQIRNHNVAFVVNVHIKILSLLWVNNNWICFFGCFYYLLGFVFRKLVVNYNFTAEKYGQLGIFRLRYVSRFTKIKSNSFCKILVKFHTSVAGRR